MDERFSRTAMLLGNAAIHRLAQARVAVFGIGGVGGYVCEALVRSGVEAFDLIDHDKVCLTNLNRQIIATQKTIGQYKTEVMKERILAINPAAKVTIHSCFFLPENADTFPFEEYKISIALTNSIFNLSLSFKIEFASISKTSLALLINSSSFIITACINFILPLTFIRILDVFYKNYTPNNLNLIKD